MGRGALLLHFLPSRVLSGVPCYGQIFAFRPTRLVATAVEYAASAVQIQWSKKLDALEDASRISLLASSLLQM